MFFPKVAKLENIPNEKITPLKSQQKPFYFGGSQVPVNIGLKPALHNPLEEILLTKKKVKTNIKRN